MNKPRKEYNDRHNAPLVNPGITYGEYEKNRKVVADLTKSGCNCGHGAFKMPGGELLDIPHTIDCIFNFSY